MPVGSGKASVVDVLKAARERIADPRHWTQGQLARDVYGHVVEVDAPNACRWCAAGSIERSRLEVTKNPDVGADAIAVLEDHIETFAITHLNDGLTEGPDDVPTLTRPKAHSAVLNAFDRAIAGETNG